MPKLILRCNYLKNAPPEHLLNYINYIGTREGVEKTDGTTALLPATARQKDLIADILSRIEDAFQLLYFAMDIEKNFDVCIEKIFDKTNYTFLTIDNLSEKIYEQKKE